MPSANHRRCCGTFLVHGSWATPGHLEDAGQQASRAGRGDVPTYRRLRAFGAGQSRSLTRSWRPAIAALSRRSPPSALTFENPKAAPPVPANRAGLTLDAKNRFGVELGGSVYFASRIGSLLVRHNDETLIPSHLGRLWARDTFREVGLDSNGTITHHPSCRFTATRRCCCWKWLLLGINDISSSRHQIKLRPYLCSFRRYWRML
jgi:hypothetical protein